jgi:hypothetical protein
MQVAMPHANQHQPKILTVCNSPVKIDFEGVVARGEKGVVHAAGAYMFQRRVEAVDVRMQYEYGVSLRQ